mgnify:CR=1 FL=1
MNTEELPESWEAEEVYFNGNFKLVAEYRNPETGEKVTISPYKDYEGPGFCNSDKVEYWPDKRSWETVAKGLHQAEHPDDAEEKALEKMRELTYSS